MDFLTRLTKQIRGFMGGLSPARRMSFVLVLALVLGGLISVVLWGRHVTYRVLFSDLGVQDAGAVVDTLKSLNVPYRLDGNGSRISVPADVYYETRLQLANQGLPYGSGVGFEVFDEPKLGMSEYMQKLNFRRALQGELGRTVMQLEEVQSARVHIVLPERALFQETQLPAKASVVIGLRPSAHLTQGQVRGIVHLVSRSVEGLDPEQITVVDTTGKVLHGGFDSAPTGMLTQSQQDMKIHVEQSLQHKIKDLLEQTVGKGKVRVQVSADLNFTEVRATKEIYDPEQAVVRSEQRQQEETTGVETAAAGIPGVKPNVEGMADAQGTQSQSLSRRSSETVNYEITRVVQNVFEPAGQVEKLSVAVLVDGAYRRAADEQGPQGEYVPRTQEELAKYRQIVQKAMGFDPVRGDQVEVVNLPFEQVEADVVGEDYFREIERRRFWAPYIQYGIVLALVFLVLLFVIRPLLKMMSVREAPVPSREDLLPENERTQLEMARRMPAIEDKTAEEDVVNRFRETAAQDPARVARLIRAWVK